MHAWWAASLTLLGVLAYEGLLAWGQRRWPRRMARTAHAELRQVWFDAVSAQPGSEILTVQTLRNSLMSATMTASTAILGLMGTLTMAAGSWHALPEADMGALAWAGLHPRLLVELALMGLLFTSLLSSVMAVRYYHHASFVGGMPVGSDARQQWAWVGAAYVRRAGVLYSLGLRQLVLVAPVATYLLHPLAGPVAVWGAVLVMLVGFDNLRHVGPGPDRH